MIMNTVAKIFKDAELENNKNNSCKELEEESTSIDSKIMTTEHKKIIQKIKLELKKVRNYTPKVGVFGDTGAGKSSLCNALFGKDTAKISNIEACTRKPQEIFIGNRDGGITLVDVPGIGEDPEHHEEYSALYRSLLGELDLILWTIKADDRKYMAAIDVYEKEIKPYLDYCPVVFVITQVDKIEPYRDWDIEFNKPGEKQKANLLIKINDISSRFDVSTNKIVAVSSTDSYNLVELVNKVVEVLPNEKKYSFTREAKDENVSEKAEKEAEKGIFDHIKSMAGAAWDIIKTDVLKVASDAVTKYAPKLVGKFVGWCKSWF